MVPHLTAPAPVPIDRFVLARWLHRTGFTLGRGVEALIARLPDRLRRPFSRLRSGFARIPPLQGIWLKRHINPFSPGSASIENRRDLLPPCRADLRSPTDGAWFEVCKYYREGWVDRPPVSTYEVASGYLLVGLGLVVTRDFRLVVEPGMRHCLDSMPATAFLRPLEAVPVAGSVATIFTLWSDNIWHFTFDCLAKICSLTRSYPDQPMTLVLPDRLTSQQREFLGLVLPPGYRAEFVPDGTWIHPQRLIVPTFVTTRANAFLPPDYLAFLRRAAFQGYGITPPDRGTERIYLSRAGAKFRRVTNEDQVMEVLAPLGFRKILPETLSWREQVELFSRAEAVVSPHNAGLATTLFSGAIPVLVLYPNPVPTTYFATQCLALGQSHYYWAGPQPTEWDDFAVDPEALRSLVTGPMGLRPPCPEAPGVRPLSS